MVTLKLFINSATEQNKYKLKDSRSPSKKLLIANSQIPVYTRSVGTRGHQSKIEIVIRLRSCTNLSGRKKDSATNRRCTLSPYLKLLYE